MAKVRTTIPVDADGAFVQVLRPKAGSSHQITTSGTVARNSTAFDTETRAIEVYATQNIYLRTGATDTTPCSDTTGDMFLPAEVTRVYALGGDKQQQHRYVAAVQVSSSGTLYITELE